MAITDHLVLPLPDRRDVRPAPDGMTLLATELQNGLPARIPLTLDLVLVLTAPTGAPDVWMQLDPATPVFQATDEAVPAQVVTGPLVQKQLPVRLYLMRGRQLVGTAMPRLGLRQLVPDTGSPLIEFALLDCTIKAGAVRGLPLTGSTIRFAWRRYALSPDDPVPPPPLHPSVAQRLAVDPDGARFNFGGAGVRSL